MRKGVKAGRRGRAINPESLQAEVTFKPGGPSFRKEKFIKNGKGREFRKASVRGDQGTADLKDKGIVARKELGDRGRHLDG